MESTISSEKFIELFITLKQVRHLGNRKDSNLFNAEWSFNTYLLNEFIFYSKRDYRYKDLLNSFSFTYNSRNNPYSIELSLALNHAKSKHLITGIYDDIAYISRFYVNNRILTENVEFYDITNSFINDFDYFCFNKEEYLKSREKIAIESSPELDNSRLVFDLQRRIVSGYEEEN